MQCGGGEDENLQNQTEKFSNKQYEKKTTTKPPKLEYALKGRYSTGKHQGKQRQKNLYRRHHLC